MTALGRLDVRKHWVLLRRRVAHTPVRTRVGEALLIVVVVALDLAVGWRSESPTALVLQGVAASLLIPLRRAVPVLVVPVAGVLLGSGVLTVVVPVLVYGAVRGLTAAGRRRRFRTPVVLVAVAVSVSLAVTLVRLPAQEYMTMPFTLAYPVAMSLLLLVVPAMFGTMTGQRRLLLRTLRERNEYLEDTRRLTETQSRLRERARIAQEMHDLLGHRLTLISLYAGALELTAAQRAPDMNEEAGIIATTARTAMGELREVLGVLRDERSGPFEAPDSFGPPADSGAEGPESESVFEEEISDLVESSRRAGLSVRLGRRRSGTTPALVVRRAVLRVLRESLTNVHKHAPASAAVDVVVETGAEKVRVAVRNTTGDPGSADRTALPGSGSGLVGLEERVRLLGGTLRHGRLAGGGFAVEADLPVAVPGEGAGDDSSGGPWSRGGGPAVDRASASASAGDSPDEVPGPRREGRAGGEGRAGRDGRAGEAGEAPRDSPAGAGSRLLRGGLGCASAVVVVLTGAALLGLWIFAETQEADANGDRYARVSTGMTREEVGHVTGPLAKDGERAEELRAHEPPPPSGAACAYALGVTDGIPVAYRYCFEGDRLIAKDTYPIDGRDG